MKKEINQYWLEKKYRPQNITNTQFSILKSILSFYIGWFYRTPLSKLYNLGCMVLPKRPELKKYFWFVTNFSSSKKLHIVQHKINTLFDTTLQVVFEFLVKSTYYICIKICTSNKINQYVVYENKIFQLISSDY